MYLNLNNIKTIQVDHTTRCNLFCAQCARIQSDWYKVSENKNIDLNLEDYKILLEPFEKNNFNIFHCGNYGDALSSPTFDETFNYTLSKEPIEISIATNGSLRSTDWWKGLAERGQGRLSVTFAIDGLSDTNHLYRVGSRWEKIINNAKAFIDAGGKAQWYFIEFEHNRHQIEEARTLAKEMGFSKFNARYTARLASKNKQSEKQEKNGVVLKDTKDNINQKSLSEIKKQYESFDEYVQCTKINCKSIQEKKVFVDMHMRLWPCCWFGAPPYFNKPQKQVPSFEHIFQLYGRDFNDLRKYGWDILNHDFFKTYLNNSWNNPDDYYKRIYTCGRTCGKKFEYSSGYGKNANISVL